MDTPIYMNQDAICCWKIKFDTIKDDIGVYDIFGVVSGDNDFDLPGNVSQHK